MAKVYESQRKWNAAYDAENTIQIKFKLNRKTDLDIIEKLESVENKQGYFKELVRADIAKQQEAGEKPEK